MAAEENPRARPPLAKRTDSSRGLAARKIRGRPRHGTELGSRPGQEYPDSNHAENQLALAPDGHTPGPSPSFHLAQARHVSSDPLPYQARRAPILRANPYPEVTDPICRLPLPTLGLSTRGS